MKDDSRALPRRQTFDGVLDLMAQLCELGLGVGFRVGTREEFPKSGTVGRPMAVQRHLTRAPVRRLQRVVHDRSQEPWGERALGVELLDPLVTAQEGVAHDVLRQLTVANDQIRRSRRLQLVLTHECFEPADVATPKPLDCVPFVGRRPGALRHRSHYPPAASKVRVRLGTRDVSASDRVRKAARGSCCHGLGETGNPAPASDVLEPVGTRAKRVIVLALAFLVAGCSAQVAAPRPSETPTTTVTPGAPNTAANDVLYVRSIGGSEQASVLVIDGRTGATLRTMPDGAISRDRSRLYSTESVNGATRTVVHVTELASGHDLLTFTVDGDLRSPLFTGSLYQLTGEMISADNRHLVLTNTPYKNEKGWVTRLAVVDVISGAVTVSTEIVAPSTYGVLGLSPDGRSVFVDQFGDGAITTRVFDVASRGLADVSRAGLSANGFRTGGVFTPDGRWMFRVDSAGAATGGPVVVALDLVDKRVVPIPLATPGKSGSEGGELWSVALTVDGSTLYAVNPAMGVVNEIDVRQLAVRRSSPIPVSRRGDGVLATIQQLLLPVVDAKRFMMGGAALSPDGRTLYAAGNSGISAIDTATLTSRQTIWRAGYLFDLLAMSPDGLRLYAVDNSTRNLIVFDPRGAFLGTISLTSMVPAIVRIDSTH